MPGTVALAGFGLTLTYLAALMPACLFYSQGLVVTWFLPDPASTSLLAGSLGLLFVVALLSTVLPWTGAVLQGLAGAAEWAWQRRSQRP